MIVPTPPLSGTYSPPQVARRWRKKPGSVIDEIKAGRLVGFDVASPGSRRPRYRITWDAILEYEAARSATPPPKPTRRRRKDPAVTEYF